MSQSPSKPDIKALQANLLDLLLMWPVKNRQLEFTTMREVMAFSDELLKFEPFSKWLSMSDVVNLVTREVSNFFRALDSSAIPEPATTLLQATDRERIEALKQRLSDYLRSIPRSYHSYWYLPSFEPFGLEEMALADDISLIRLAASEDLPVLDVKPGSLAELFRRGGWLGTTGHLEPTLYTGRIYLRISARGYASDDADASANVYALGRVKQAIEFGHCLRLFQRGFSGGQSHCFSRSASDPKSEHAWVHQQAEVASYLGRVSFEMAVLESAATALKVADLSKAEVQANLFLKRYRTGSEVLRRPAGDSDAVAIRTACEWSFDSRANGNDTVAFLQACIGLEAILGEGASKDEPLVGQLSDRCAYLIGRTINDRREIKKLFKDIYDVRSKIVHGRRARLEAADLKMLRVAQELLTDVIAREASLLSAQ